jgi:hypothetical protein
VPAVAVYKTLAISNAVSIFPFRVMFSCAFQKRARAVRVRCWPRRPALFWSPVVWWST